MKAAALILLGLVVTAGNQVASAQSLGELAAKEKERRKAQSVERAGQTVKVYGQNDVRAAMVADDAAVFEGESGKRTTLATTASPTPGADPQEAQKQQWRTRADALRSELAAAEKDARAWDVLGPGLTGPTPDQGVRARARLATVKQRLDALEEEARLAGVPPGWVR
jgi:hypothetical protein